MKKVLIVKNNSREDGGLIELVLREEKIPFDLVDLEAEDQFPAPASYAAVFVMGGPDSANDKTEKMQQEIKRIQEYLALGIPYFGICLGLQVLVKAAGGSVVKNSVKEIGFYGPDGKPFEVALTPEGREDLLFAGISERFKIFHLHGETVQLAAGMKLLGRGKFCENQIVKVADKAYGFQGHFELTREMLGLWAITDPDLLGLDSGALDHEYLLMEEKYSQQGRQILHNFLQIAGLLRRPVARIGIAPVGQ